MVEDILDALVASIFLIIVIFIGVNIPYLAAKIFGANNPYAVLETAGFITYATSIPGGIQGLIYISSGPSIGYEFRIAPPINTGWVFGQYNNNDFLVSIGYCENQNLWDQFGMDFFNSVLTAMFAQVPAADEAEIALEGAETLVEESPSVSSLVQSYLKSSSKLFANSFAGNEIFGTAIGLYRYLQDQNSGGIGTALYSSAMTILPTALEGAAVGTLEVLADNAIIAATGPIGYGISIGVNMIVNSAITLYNYENIANNDYARCYYNDQLLSSGQYFVYYNLLSLPVFYNPEFSLINQCYLDAKNPGNQEAIYYEYLCNGFNSNQQNQTIYQSGSQYGYYIFKLELGVEYQGYYYYPAYLSLDKNNLDGNHEINISIIPNKIS
ncbi:hypothetical protein MJ1_0047 [Nanobdella aerobiophila]|uniref:Uncharacterized protein n=1 Tax=Nanobdella aerobiophila TaxID=2586965 RepID=A0A915SKC1_9ARCH|nr:hypothetical protein [Nanobdella aerobiophila]BBL45226.1 hypothetical protein MJ1_0047 [Nanobdella aerobiophila]